MVDSHRIIFFLSTSSASSFGEVSPFDDAVVVVESVRDAGCLSEIANDSWTSLSADRWRALKRLKVSKCESRLGKDISSKRLLHGTVV